MKRYVAAVVVVLTLGSSGAAAAVGATHPRPAPSYVDTASPAQRHAQTVAFAKQIFQHRPVLSDEQPLTGTVPKSLRDPDDFPAANNRLTRSHYRTVDVSAHQAYVAYKAMDPSRLRLDGYGDVNDGGMGSRQAQVRYDWERLPATMADGELLIEIQGRKNGPTILAEFVEIVPHPAWTKAERIPAAHSHATATRTKYSKDHHAEQPRTRHLSSGKSHALASAFDNSFVAPPWACTGGVPPLGAYSVFKATIRSHGHTWHLTPGPCDVTAVRRGHHRYLADIDGSKQFTALLKADAPSATK